MSKLSFVLVALLAAAGCKKGGGDDCATAVNHSMELSKDMMKKMGNDDAMLGKMRDLGVQHCKDDKWPAEATKCMIDAKDVSEAQGCYGKLSADQQEKMNKAAMALQPAAPAAPAAPAPAAPAPAAAPAGSAGSDAPK